MNKRDKLIFKMILKGWTYKRIAAELKISRDTVEDVLCRLKLHYKQSSVQSLIAYLYENKLIENYELKITERIPGMYTFNQERYYHELPTAPKKKNVYQ